MFQLIGLAIALASFVFGFATARQFVRRRLRYVEGIQGLKAPVVAGIVGFVVAMIPFSIIPLPFLTMSTAAFFGVSVAAGVRAGANDVASGKAYIEGP